MKKKICIIVANYYPEISKKLLKGATEELNKLNFSKKKKTYYVPGIFEVPVTIAKKIKYFDAFIALGCVIKGKTPHFDLISTAVVNALMDISVNSKKPIGNGIITCLNKKQAIERASSGKKNKGKEAAKAVFATLKNFKNV